MFNLNDAPAEAKAAGGEGGEGEGEAAVAEAQEDAPVGPAKVVARDVAAAAAAVANMSSKSVATLNL